MGTAGNRLCMAVSASRPLPFQIDRQLMDSMPIPSYSIAIRTLGTAGEKFRQELASIKAQTRQPDRVLVYIAEGYARPPFQVGREEYVWVKKGMVAQRALPYDEVASDCILLLDDDVLLAPDSAERLLRAMATHDADCVAADVFRNHTMPFRTKLFAAVTGWVLPHGSPEWAFRMRRSGSFSYNARPVKPYYASQTCGGPAMLWRKSALRRICLADECWLDALGFAYGDDALESYKLYRNGGRLGVLYDAGIRNLDAASASAAFKRSPERVYLRTKASLLTWWRSCYRNGADTPLSRMSAAIAFGCKALWLLPVMAGASLAWHDRKVLPSYLRGLRDGRREARSAAFRALPPYIFP